MLNIKNPISDIISISNLQISSHFTENINIYIPKPKIYKINIFYSFLIGLILGKLWLFTNKNKFFIGKLFIDNVNIYILKYINIRILKISLFWKLFLFLFCIFILIDIYQIYYYNNFISFN
jgi:hypothetical protein